MKRPVLPRFCLYPGCDRRLRLGSRPDGVAVELPPQPRLGYTLVEILVATTLSLLLLGAVVRMFGDVGQGITDSRAMLESADRLRVVQARLQQDLSGVTVTMIPPRRPENNEGYFEYIEGPVGAATMTNLSTSDTRPLNPAVNSDLTTTPNFDTTVGDFDDILMFTTRSTGRPFVGRYNGNAVQSDVAEVAWFVRGRTLYRRVLLVAPALNPLVAGTNYLNADISMSIQPATATGVLRANTLGDLTRRECRYAHQCWPTPATPDSFPYDVSRWYWLCSLPSGYTYTPTPAVIPTLPTLRECSSTGWSTGKTHPPSTTATPPSTPLDFWSNNGAYRVADNAMTASLSMSDGTRIADDVILTNVIGFDVKAWDPTAPVLYDSSQNRVILPGDASYVSALSGGSPNIVGYGAYVDLGYCPTYATGSYFSSTGAKVDRPLTDTDPNAYLPRVYDTWSTHYESAGRYSGDTLAGRSTNGFDDDSDGIVDNDSEKLTSPPYPVQLRGIQVKIRVFEPDSRQIREVTVVQDFLPQ